MLRNKETGCKLHFVYMKADDGTESFMAFDPEATDFTKACEVLEEKILEKRFNGKTPLA